MSPITTVILDEITFAVFASVVCNTLDSDPEKNDKK